jgi:hypothetical protein
MKKDSPNFVILLQDSISHKYSWLNQSDYMPELFNKKKDFINYNNHFATSQNSRANVSSILTGGYPSNHRIIDKNQNFGDYKYKYIQQKLEKIGYTTYFFSTQAIGSSRFDKGEQFRFKETNFITPSLAEFYIPGENYNKLIKEKFKTLNKPYLIVLFYTDAHEPFDTPNLNYFSMDIPLIKKFILKSLLNGSVFKRCWNKLKIRNTIRNELELYFKEYPLLEKNIHKHRGSILLVESLRNFYEILWKNDDFLNEYKIIMKKSINYQDRCTSEILDYFKNEELDNAIFFLTADHGMNALQSPEFKNKNGVINEETTHIPLSVFTFDKKLKEKLKLYEKEINNYTSHIDIHETIINLVNLEKHSFKYANNLLDEIDDERLIVREIFGSRQKHNYIYLTNLSKNLMLKAKGSDDIKNYFDKHEIVNSINDIDYEFCKKYKLDIAKEFKKSNEV